MKIYYLLDISIVEPFTPSGVGRAYVRVREVVVVVYKKNFREETTEIPFTVNRPLELRTVYPGP